MPYSSFTGSDFFGLISTFSDLFFSLVGVSAAFLLSRWVYGVGPLPLLSSYHYKLKDGNNA
jgi:hypothetical protein